MNTMLLSLTLISRIICDSSLVHPFPLDEEFEDYSTIHDIKDFIDDSSFQESFVIIDYYDLWTSDDYVKEEIRRVEDYRSSGYLSRIWNGLINLLDKFSYKLSCTKQKYVMNGKLKKKLIEKISDIRKFMNEDSQSSLLVNYIIVSVVSSKLRSSLQNLVLIVDMLNRVDTNNTILQFIDKLNVRQFVPKDLLDANQKFLEYVDQKISSIDQFKYENAKFEDFISEVVVPIFNDILTCYQGVPKELL